MSYVTREYYANTFHGITIPDGEFDRLAEMASDIIDAIVYKEIDLEKIDNDLLAKAASYQLEMIYQQGGIDAATGSATSQMVTSEHLDEYSISEQQSEKAKAESLSLNGIPVSPLCVAILRKLGLMCRWFYAGKGLHYDGY